MCENKSIEGEWSIDYKRSEDLDSKIQYLITTQIEKFNETLAQEMLDALSRLLNRDVDIEFCIENKDRFRCVKSLYVECYYFDNIKIMEISYLIDSNIASRPNIPTSYTPTIKTFV